MNFRELEGACYVDPICISIRVFCRSHIILAKCGIKKTDSNVATAIRTIIVLLFSWIMVFVVGSQSVMTVIEAKTLVFLVLSGLATGASWLCYFQSLAAW